MTSSIQDSAVSLYQELTHNSENWLCGLSFHEHNKFGLNIAISEIKSLLFTTLDFAITQLFMDLWHHLLKY